MSSVELSWVLWCRVNFVWLVELFIVPMCELVFLCNEC
jgi:hypothetical protein